MVFVLRHFKKWNDLRTTYQALWRTDFDETPFFPEISDDNNPKANKMNGASCTPGKSGTSTKLTKKGGAKKGGYGGGAKKGGFGGGAKKGAGAGGN